MTETYSRSATNNWNQQIIEEFSSNGGKVGGPFAHSRLLLLTSTGAKSGQRRVNPLAYFVDGDRFIIIASKGGAPTNPDWYYNLLAHPEATIEVGTQNFDRIETFDVVATEAKGEERDRLFAWVAEQAPGFGEYQTKTSRKIPVIVLKRK